jgi:hypothetical protein
MAPAHASRARQHLLSFTKVRLNEGCDYTAEMEPDQTQGWCEACGTNTVASALVLAGLI